jgi:hypothetical protein
MKTATWRNAAAAMVLATSALLALPATASPTTGPVGTSEFRGVNWADPRDNYASDAVVPSGLSTADDYATTYRHRAGVPS